VAPQQAGKMSIGGTVDLRISVTKGSADMADEQELNDSGSKAYFIAVTYAAQQTGIPADQLTRDDFLKAAAIAEESGDLRMTQRLLLLADDEVLPQGDR
jgi:hypothetical protein